MANTDYEFIYTVEDYSGVSTGVVMDAGQTRWFDTVTGHDATEVIQLTGDGAASIATLLSRHDNITVVGSKDFSGAVTFSGSITGKTFDVIDTDSADVAATVPTSPSDGDEWYLFNSGTSGNHITGVPNSISIGDLKSLTLKYDATGTQWIYEDVIIDESSAVDGTSSDVTHYVKRWSGGKMEVNSVKASGSSAARTCVYPTAFTSRTSITSLWGAACAYVTSSSITGLVFGSATLTGATSTAEVYVTTIGKWKSGI